MTLLNNTSSMILHNEEGERMANNAFVLIDPGDGVQVSRMNVKLDPRTTNMIRLYSDGLWCGPPDTYNSAGLDITVDADNDIGPNLLEPNQCNLGINVDYGPWSTFDNLSHVNYYNAISCQNTIHKIWNAEFSSTTTLVDGSREPIHLTGKNTSDVFRTHCDWVLPGDFFRVKNESDTYDYFIITEVSGDDSTPGNKIAAYALLLQGAGDF